MDHQGANTQSLIIKIQMPPQSPLFHPGNKVTFARSGKSDFYRHRNQVWFHI